MLSGRTAYSSSTGTYGGGVSNGRPRTVSLDAQTTFLMPARRAALNTWWVATTLLANVAPLGRRPGAGIAARCTTASTPSYRSSMPVSASVTWPRSVRSTRLNTARWPGRRQRRVDVDHVVPVLREVLDDRAPELALTHR